MNFNILRTGQDNLFGPDKRDMVFENSMDIATEKSGNYPTNIPTLVVSTFGQLSINIVFVNAPPVPEWEVKVFGPKWGNPLT